MQNKDDFNDDYAFALQLQEHYNNEYSGSITHKGKLIYSTFVLLGKVSTSH
jgi:hypothetical protein